MNIERIARALRDAQTVLEALEGDEREAIAPALHAIANSERSLYGGSAATAEAPGPERFDPVEEAPRVSELERKLAAQEAFAAALAHELRNLLAPIVMQAEYLLEATRHAENGVVAGDWLSPRLTAFCGRLRKFVETFNRVMDASRVTAGRIQLELEEVDLSAVVRDVCASFEREALAARSTITVHTPPELMGCWDRLRLEQICTNLVSNAIRYGAGRPIEVSVTADADWAELEVRDLGIGIAPEDQQRIFERFERAGQQQSTGGFGIGLWIVREICHALGGSIAVKSSVGQGSTFCARLPRRVRMPND